MSFLTKFSSIVDARIFSLSGLTDEWTANANKVQCMLEERELLEDDIYVTRLVLDIRDIDRDKFARDDVITRTVDGLRHKVWRIGKPINGIVSIILRDENA